MKVVLCFGNEVLEESLEQGKVQDESLGCTSSVVEVEWGDEGKLKYRDRVELGIEEVATTLSPSRVHSHSSIDSKARQQQQSELESDGILKGRGSYKKVGEV